MSTQPRTHAMIVAAGQGSRFGADTPKQYLSLHGQTLLQHSVAKLACSRYIDNCLLVVAANDCTACTLTFALPVYFATGGNERWQSVQAGLDTIIDAGAKESDLVLIHDAARPAVPSEDVEQVIEAAMLEPYGAILAAPVADTLKESHLSSVAQSSCKNNTFPYIKRTIDRSTLWQAQTPQVFRIGQLRQVLTHISQHNLTITDEASAFEYLDRPIRLITGSRQNIKLTYPSDASLLSAILKTQS